MTAIIEYTESQASPTISARLGAGVGQGAFQQVAAVLDNRADVGWKESLLSDSHYLSDGLYEALDLLAGDDLRSYKISAATDFALSPGDWARIKGRSKQVKSISVSSAGISAIEAGSRIKSADEVLKDRYASLSNIAARNSVWSWRGQGNISDEFGFTRRFSIKSYQIDDVQHFGFLLGFSISAFQSSMAGVDVDAHDHGGTTGDGDPVPHSDVGTHADYGHTSNAGLHDHDSAVPVVTLSSGEEDAFTRYHIEWGDSLYMYHRGPDDSYYTLRTPSYGAGHYFTHYEVAAPAMNAGHAIIDMLLSGGTWSNPGAWYTDFVEPETITTQTDHIHATHADHVAHTHEIEAWTYETEAIVGWDHHHDIDTDLLGAGNHSHLDHTALTRAGSDDHPASSAPIESDTPVSYTIHEPTEDADSGAPFSLRVWVNSTELADSPFDNLSLSSNVFDIDITDLMILDATNLVEMEALPYGHTNPVKFSITATVSGKFALR